MVRVVGAVLLAGCITFVTSKAAEPQQQSGVAAMVVPRVSMPALPLSDEAMIVLAGTALLMVAALVRRAT